MFIKLGKLSHLLPPPFAHKPERPEIVSRFQSQAKNYLRNFSLFPEFTKGAKKNQCHKGDLSDGVESGKGWLLGRVMFQFSHVFMTFRNDPNRMSPASPQITDGPFVWCEGSVNITARG